MHFLSDIFDVQVYSCFEGTAKPERDIYLTVIDRMDMKPYELVFIDDTIDNIIAGQSIGLNCVHYIASDQVKDKLITIMDKENG